MLSLLFQSVCPYGNSDSHWKDFPEISYCEFLLKFVIASWLVKIGQKGTENYLHLWDWSLCSVSGRTWDSRSGWQWKYAFEHGGLRTVISPVLMFWRYGLWSTVNQLQGCEEIVLCVSCKTWRDVRSRVQKFLAWHTKAAPNGKCCEGYIVPSVVRLMYHLKSVLK